MPKAKKLPSGNYRVRVLVGKDKDGKKIYKSFTDSNKRKAELMASEYLVRNTQKTKKTSKLTLLDACEKYIAKKEPVLSPTTIREYKRYEKEYFQDIINKNIWNITSDVLQDEINKEVVKGKSRKTILNIYSFFVSALKSSGNNENFDVTLPKKIKTELYIPTDEEIKKLYNEFEGTYMEIPFLLCAFLGLRRSEVCALNWEDIDFEKQILHVYKAKVLNDKKEWVIKQTKTTAGKRNIKIYDFVFEKLYSHKDEKGQIVSIYPNTLYTTLNKTLDKLKIQHFRLHDLRHYTASMLLALGVPNKYAMNIMGHETERMLTTVYQHCKNSKMDEFNNEINSFINSSMV